MSPPYGPVATSHGWTAGLPLPSVIAFRVTRSLEDFAPCNGLHAMPRQHLMDDSGAPLAWFAGVSLYWLACGFAGFALATSLAVVVAVCVKAARDGERIIQSLAIRGWHKTYNERK